MHKKETSVIKIQREIKWDVQVCLPLRRVIRRSSEILSELVVILLEGNADIFSPVCNLEIGVAKYVGTGIVKV